MFAALVAVFFYLVNFPPVLPWGAALAGIAPMVVWVVCYAVANAAWWLVCVRMFLRAWRWSAALPARKVASVVSSGEQEG